MASRTAAGFVVLVSDDGTDLVNYVTEHQMAPDLIERLADQISASDPRSMVMLFTSGGNPYLLAWGQAVASVASGAARFTVTPLVGQLLVHPLTLDAESTIVLSDGALAGDPETAPINLAEGSMHADAVVIDLRGDVPTEWQLPVGDGLPIADPAQPAPLPADLEPAAIPVDDTDAVGQPAAQGIVFADDIEEISDLLAPAAQAPPTAPETPVEPAGPGPVELAPAWQEPAAEAGTFQTAATPFTAEATAAEPVDVALVGFDAQQVETSLVPAATDPAFDVPVVIPLSRASAHQLSAAPAAPAVEEVPLAIPADVRVPQVPPEFRREPVAEEPEAAPAIPGTVPAPAAPVPATPASSPAPLMVLGVVCPQGHHNHPEAVYCSQCGTKMGVHHTTVLVNGPRPSLGVLVVDDGTTFSIDSDLVIGRDPASHVDVRAGAAGAMVLVDDTLALSRQHARIVLDDWAVHVADLGSSNGTWLNRGPNPQEWMSVETGTTVPLEPGDRIKVGGRVIQVELHHIR
jgi:hypothetical protein